MGGPSIPDGLEGCGFYANSLKNNRFRQETSRFLPVAGDLLMKGASFPLAR
jgi:hypothetical protein